MATITPPPWGDFPRGSEYEALQDFPHALYLSRYLSYRDTLSGDDPMVNADGDEFVFGRLLDGKHGVVPLTTTSEYM